MIGPAELEEMMTEHAEAVANGDPEAIAKALAWSADRPSSQVEPPSELDTRSYSFWPQFGFGSFSD